MLNVEIRPMNNEDISEIAYLIVISFWPKMLPLKNISEVEAIKIVSALMFFDKRSLGYYHVAVLNDKVLGMIKLREANDKENFFYFDFHLLFRIGIVKLMQTAAIMALFDAKIHKDHLYIELLSVKPEYGGQGIGSQLLDYALKSAENRKNVNTISLHVIERNIRAKKLYEQKGYVTKGWKWHSILNKYSGVGKVYTMERHL